MFLSFVVISFLSAIIFGLKNKYAFINTKKYFLHLSVIGTVASLILGLAQGTFYSHGFDIYWWLFSITNLLAIFLGGLIALVITKSS